MASEAESPSDHTPTSTSPPTESNITTAEATDSLDSTTTVPATETEDASHADDGEPTLNASTPTSASIADEGAPATRASKEAVNKGGQIKDSTKIRLLALNIPYDLKWQDLKDLFKEKVGPEVCFVEIYEGPDGKSAGTGMIEVKGKELADRTIAALHKTELRNRLLVIREEKEKDRQMYQRYGVFDHQQQQHHIDNNHGGSNGFFENLGIDMDCLSNQIFIANLDYSVTVKKIKEVFLMAGTILQVDLKMDKGGSSRGLATVCYENVVEAIQAIGMFNGQYLYDRPMNVRMDRLGEALHQHVPPVLPSGLKGVAPGLGPNGQPLINIGHIANLLVLNNIMNVPSTGKLMNVFMAGNSHSAKSRPTSTGGLPQYSFSNNVYNHYNSTYNTSNNPYNSQYADLNNNPYNHHYYNIAALNSLRYSSLNNYSNNYMPSILRASCHHHGHHHNPFSSSHPSRHDVTTVVIKNLPYSVTWQALKDKFKDAGDIQYAEVKMEGGRSKGVASVRFASVEAARKAVALFNGTKLEGRSIEVKGNF